MKLIRDLLVAALAAGLLISGHALLAMGVFAAYFVGWYALQAVKSEEKLVEYDNVIPITRKVRKSGVQPRRL